MISRYTVGSWNDITDEKVADFFSGIPEPWSATYNTSTASIEFFYDGDFMLGVSNSATKYAYNGGESTETVTNRNDSSGYPLKSVHIAEHGFAFRNGTNEMLTNGDDIYIFTEDNKGNPAIIWVQPASKTQNAPASLSFTAWNLVDTVTPPKRQQNNYTNSIQTELVPFVIESEVLETRFTPYAFWLPVASLETDTGHLKTDYIPVKDSDNNQLFYNAFTAFA